MSHYPDMREKYAYSFLESELSFYSKKYIHTLTHMKGKPTFNRLVWGQPGMGKTMDQMITANLLLKGNIKDFVIVWYNAPPEWINTLNIATITENQTVTTSGVSVAAIDAMNPRV